jgi:RNA polymerase sigma-70 factor (ECF subfamily)
LKVKEQKVWERITAGDGTALAELYDSIGTRLFSLSFQILHDRWDAEEVVQDAFAALWKNPRSYSPQKGKLSSWLMVLVRNRSIDRYRSRKRRKDTTSIEVSLEVQPQDENEDVVSSASQTDEKKLLGAAIQKLPKKQLRVLELSYFKGMTHPEIAEELGLSLGTVKSRIRLGVEKLRNSLPGNLEMNAGNKMKD